MKSLEKKNINNTILHKRSLSNLDDNINDFSLEDFYSQLKKVYNDAPIEKVLIQSISNSNNLLGEGREGDVFQIDKIPKYVVKIPKNYSFNQIKGNFFKAKDEFPTINFGQAIASNSDNILILKRVYGQAHGPLMGKVTKQKHKLMSDDVKMTLEQIIKISKFPLKSYIEFANQIKIINQHQIFCVDMLNPNNLMVDFKSQKLQLIDLFNRNRIPLLEDFSGDIHSMINLILCALYHSEIYSQLNDNERKELKNAVIEVVNKCEISSNIVNLPLSKLTPIEVYDRVIEFSMFKRGLKEKEISLSDKYRAFKALYLNILPEFANKIIPFNQKSFFKKIKSRLILCDYIQPCYLMYLYEKKKLNDNDILEIISLITEKIPQKDFEYFIHHKISSENQKIFFLKKNYYKI